MATIKSHTSPEQSKKLAEILPLESADMFYDGVQDLYKEKVYNIPIDGSSITVRTGHIITEKGIKANLLLPCWSLAALLGVLPRFIEFKGDKYYLRFMKEYVEYANDEVSITGRCLHTTGNDNLVDACYEMILKLHELKML